jgi:hypothetical protein
MSDNNISDKIENKPEDSIIKYYDIIEIIIGFIFGGGPIITGYLLYRNIKIFYKNILVIIIGMLIFLLSIILDLILIYNYFQWFHYHLLLFLSSVLKIFCLYIILCIILFIILKITTKNIKKIKYDFKYIFRYCLFGFLFKIIVYISISILFGYMMLKAHQG